MSCSNRGESTESLLYGDHSAILGSASIRRPNMVDDITLYALDAHQYGVEIAKW